MAALQVQMLRNFFGDFDHRINELTSASERWEVAKTWILDNFDYLLLLTGAVLIPAFIFIVVVDHWDIDYPQPVGCKRVGHTNSIDDAAAKDDESLITPVAGCRSIETDDQRILHASKQFDCQFAFAQLTTSRPEKQKDGSEKTTSSWRLLFPDKVPRLGLVEVQLWVPDESNRQYNVAREAIKNGGSLIISFPFSPDFAPDRRYVDYLYSSIRIKYIKRDWSAQPTITFEVPFTPTQERMQRKSYGPSRDIELWKGTSEVIDMGKEIGPAVLAKLQYHLGISNPVTLFRKSPGN